MELKIVKIQDGFIEINFDEIKIEVQERLKKYQGIMVVEDKIDEAKSDRAMLNKNIETLDTWRKEKKKQFMQPFTEVENQVKEIVNIIEQTKSSIDKQIKEFEEKYRQEKRSQIEAIWRSKQFKLVLLPQIYDIKWENKGLTLKKIEEEIDTIIQSINTNIEAIKVFTNDVELQDTLKTKYLLTLDLSKVIQEYQKEQELKTRISVSKQEEVKAEEQEKTDQPTYVITFQVEGTYQELQKLSNFLKQNNYNYQTIKEN